ncbi:hypothetical protein PLICRDRAFT_175794 [Plicaturopsis crispa FD-325 SS-3]|nr:hypothetical protein PLICRDRAFT_175794 [Plicaturopsis crispa FD-325 SS-3]
MACTSCCLVCTSEGGPSLEPVSQISDPYALKNLLAAGTTEVALAAQASIPCYHKHAEDGWHHFPGKILLPILSNTAEEDRFIRELDFLITNLFVSATCRLDQSRTMLYIRIYLIPWDLANVQGVLRIRDEGIVKVAGTYMQKVLQRLVKNTSCWEGAASSVRLGNPIWLLSRELDVRTMAEIYGDLPSPEVDEEVLSGITHIKGMRSVLYPYQRRSVAAMMQREHSPRDIPDPLYVPIVGMTGQDTFYLQPAHMEVLRDRPRVTQNRGGVLCEELGTGKTVMILALILSTLDDIPSPEESILDTRPILTPLAFKHFPSAEFSDARRRASSNGKTNNRAYERELKVPSLVDILLHRIRVAPKALDLRRYEQDLENRMLSHLISSNTPFYHHYEFQPLDRDTRRGNVDSRPRVMYLTIATLVVVPANLISQWEREILKHVEIQLRVLVLRRTTPMASARKIASDYDIVLMTHERLSAEASKGTDTNLLHSLPLCRCPDYPTGLVPDCNCPGHPQVTPLLQIRWKRLVIDEGHVSATNFTNLTHLAKRLSVERRWIVTGTPTTNLLGLSFGNHSELVKDADAEDGQEADDHTENGVVKTEDMETDAQGAFSARRWTKYDRQDLRKLAIMMVHFLRIPHFASQSKIFDTHVIPPLLNANGPLPGAIQVLQQVMQMTMIRHRIDDVEKDVVLPPVATELVLLDLDPYAVKSYNALQALIAINAIESERIDQDYFFHSSNTEFLKQTVENMSQLMFWGVSDDLFNVDALTLKARVEELFSLPERLHVSESDVQLLQKSVAHMQSIGKDMLWRSMHDREDVPFRVHNIPQTVYAAWTRSALGPAQDTQYSKFMHPDRLRKLRDTMLGRPLMREELVVEMGQVIAEQDREMQLFLAEAERLKDGKSKKTAHRPVGSVNSKAADPTKGAASPEKLDEMLKELEYARKRLEALAEADEATVPGPAATSFASTNSTAVDGMKAGLLASSPLANIRVGASASSKLNYILNEVIQYAPKEKFLVFSRSPLSLAHVAEGLDLIGVKYLQFTTAVPPQVREQLVMTFETSETFRVFLMELKHGARGLNLVSASRVIFCEPVWQADVESQAIKRAHRIGQTRQISVKTLAIKNTAEEAMVRVRKASQGKMDKLPDMTEHRDMRDFIANPKFLDDDPPVAPLDVPLFNIRPREEHAQDDTVSVTTAPKPLTIRIRPVNSIVQDEPPPKKRKGVHFADD